MKKLFVPVFALALCAGAAWMYATPYLAMNDLQAAAEAGDAAALRERVDFPAFRQSVKDEVKASLAREVGKKNEEFGALAALFAGALMDPLVNAFVSPEGVATLVRGQKPDGDGPKGLRKEAKKVEDDVRIERGYEGLDRFVITFIDKDDEKERLSLVMRREGLSDWKLSGIRLPAEAVGEK